LNEFQYTMRVLTSTTRGHNHQLSSYCLNVGWLYINMVKVLLSFRY